MTKPNHQVDKRVLKTRQRVLETAQRLLFEEGPTALTYSALSEEAGVGRTILYRHWPTIEDLWSFISSATTSQTHVEPTGDLRHDPIAAMTIVEQMARTESGRQRRSNARTIPMG